MSSRYPFLVYNDKDFTPDDTLKPKDFKVYRILYLWIFIIYIKTKIRVKKASRGYFININKSGKYSIKVINGS